MSIGVAHLSCREVVELVTAYLEGALDSDTGRLVLQTLIDVNREVGTTTVTGVAVWV